MGPAMYYTRVTLTPEEWLDLEWWEAALKLDMQVQAHSTSTREA